MFCCAALILAGTLSAMGAVPPALPPPGDGDIRVLYWDLPNEAEVWLTLEPKSAGKPAPPGMILTFTLRFPGKRPPAPPSRIDVRAYAGLLWQPRVELWFLLDDRQKIDLAGQADIRSLVKGRGSNYLPATITVDALTQIAESHRTAGNALGVECELTELQRRSLRSFLDRVLSDDPGNLSRHL